MTNEQTALSRRLVTAERERDEARAALAAERKRADSLAHAYRQEQGESDALKVEIAACRNQVAAATALGVSLHKAADRGAKAERKAVVAWLRAEAYLTLYEATPSDVADAIESGEHRRKETK